MNSIKIGILGYGMAGQTFHAPIIASVEGLEIAAIRTRNKDNIARARNLIPGVNIVQDNEEIINDPEIDLVLVLTPNEYHFPLAKAALEKDKHVVVDKPITIHSKEALELIKVAESKKKVLSVYQNRRFDGDLRTIKSIIDAKTLGKLAEFELHYDRFRNFLKGNWREKDEPGSGILYDLGPHIIDQALYLFGLPERIFADVKIQRSISSTIDYFDLDLFYPENFKVILKGGMLVKELGPRMQLHGENGSFIKYGIDPQEESLKAGLLPNDDPNWGRELPEFYGTLNYVENGSDKRQQVETQPGDYRDYYRNIRDAINGEAELFVKPTEAYHNIRLIELAMESAEKLTPLQVDFK